MAEWKNRRDAADRVWTVACTTWSRPCCCTSAMVVVVVHMCSRIQNMFYPEAALRPPLVLARTILAGQAPAVSTLGQLYSICWRFPTSTPTVCSLPAHSFSCNIDHSICRPGYYDNLWPGMERRKNRFRRANSSAVHNTYHPPAVRLR